jgi:predicted nuclease with TOPRIM domain
MIPDNLTEYAGGLAGGLLAFVFLLQKFLTGWKSDKTENSVITLMHGELERMSEQNTKLSEELGKLQGELIVLNTELRSLHAENQRLHSEVSALTDEVARLHGMLKKEVQ